MQRFTKLSKRCVLCVVCCVVFNISIFPSSNITLLSLPLLFISRFSLSLYLFSLTLLSISPFLSLYPFLSLSISPSLPLSLPLSLSLHLPLFTSLALFLSLSINIPSLLSLVLEGKGSLFLFSPSFVRNVRKNYFEIKPLF